MIENSWQLRKLPPWRRRMAEFTHNRYFTIMVTAAIIFAAGELAWPYVTWPNLEINNVKFGHGEDPKMSMNVVTDIFVLLIFLVEAVAKILAYGTGLQDGSLKTADDAKKDGTKDDGPESKDATPGSKDIKEVQSLEPADEQAIDEMFKLFDVEKTGSINIVAVRLAMRGLGLDESAENLEHVMEDVERDGKQDIEFHDFKAIVSSRILNQSPPPGYFVSRWNQFDFTILLICWAVLPFQYDYPNAVRVSDIARLVRLARLWAVLESYKLHIVKDVLLVLSTSIISSVQVFTLLICVLVIYATMGTSIYGDGGLHTRCVVSIDNQYAGKHQFGRTSTVGELQQPMQFCGATRCDTGFECACDKPEIVLIAHGPGANIGCSRIPVGELGQFSGAKTVTNDFGFLGFDDFPHGFFTSYIGITQTRWTRTLEVVMYAYDAASAFIFFISLFIIGRLWIVNLLTASVTATYMEISQQRRILERAEIAAAAERRLVKRFRTRKNAESANYALSPEAEENSRYAKILSRLGDLKDVDSKQLSSRIREVFSQFDHDHSGAIDVAELHIMLEQMGVSMTREEEERLHLRADKNQDGTMDEDEFEELVKSIIAQSRKEAREARQIFMDDLREEREVKLFRYITVDKSLFEPNTVPLNAWSLAIAKLLAYPHTLDECGERVPFQIVTQALRRNLVIDFGPEHRQWTVYAGEGGASIGINVRRGPGPGKKNVARGPAQKELFPSGQPIPGGQGISGDHYRDDLQDFIQQFDIHSKYLKENGEETAQTTKPSEISYSELVALMFILFSTIVMCCLHFEGSVDSACNDSGMCPEELRIMSTTWIVLFQAFEFIFNGMFTIEAILKACAYGFPRYIVHSHNQFDFLVVLICDIGLILWYVLGSRSNISFIRLVRLFRFLSMMKLVHLFLRSEGLYHKGVPGLFGQVSISFMLIFSVSVGGIIGMNSFPCPKRPKVCLQNERDSQGLCPAYNVTCNRSPLCPLYVACPYGLDLNFNSFSDAFNSMFSVAMTKGWEDLMFAGMRMYPTPLYGVVFFLSAYCFLNYFVANAFIAVILDSFRLTDEAKEKIQIADFNLSLQAVLSSELTRSEQDVGNHAREVLAHLFEDTSEETSGSLLWFARRQTEIKAHQVERYTIFGSLPAPMPDELNPDAPRNLRGMARDLLSTSWWENIVLIAIVISSILLALSSPISDYSVLEKLDNTVGASVSGTLTISCFVVFVMEMVLKILVAGVFWESEHAYLRQYWNMIDFVIVLAFALDLGGLSNITVIRILRSLRITRLVRSGPVVQLEHVLISAASDLRALMFLGVFIFTVCSITAESFFSGTLNFCTDSDQGLRVTHMSISCDPSLRSDCSPEMRKLLAPPISSRVDCIGTYLDSRNSNGSPFVFQGDFTEILRPRTWSNPTFSFDNFGWSFQTLIEVFALDEWTNIASSASSSVGIGKSPAPKQQASAWLFFIIFLVVTRMSLLPLFLGVLVDHLSKVQGTATTTTLQENWSRFQEKLKMAKPINPVKLPSSAFRRRMYAVVKNNTFKTTGNVIILLNVILLASYYYNQDQTWGEFSSWMNVAFVFFYVIEISFKLIAYGLSFFEDLWNNFDLTIVTFGVLEVLQLPGLDFRAILVLRVFRCIRIVRILRSLSHLQLMLTIVFKSARLIFGALLLICVYTFFFSVLGCQFFAGVKRGRGIRDDFNLDTTLKAFQYLFTIATGDGFSAALRDGSVQQPLCTTCKACYIDIFGQVQDFSDCGVPIPGAQIFFDVYLLLAHSVLLQLLVGVVVDQYLATIAETKFVLQKHHLDCFQQHWQALDPEGTGKISIWSLRTILERLHLDDNPLGSCALCDEFNHRSVRFEILEGQEDPTYFEFHKTLSTLALRVAGAKALPYLDMIKRREQLAFYAQAAVISKAALLSGKHRHEQNVQGNLVAQRLLGPAGDGPPLKNVERTTFCFPLLSDERMVVVDVSTAAIHIQRGAACDTLEASIPVQSIAELRCKAQGADTNVVHLRTTDGRHFAVDFFDQAQAGRFAAIVRTVRKVTAFK